MNTYHTTRLSDINGREEVFPVILDGYEEFLSAGMGNLLGSVASFHLSDVPLCCSTEREVERGGKKVSELREKFGIELLSVLA